MLLLYFVGSTLGVGSYAQKNFPPTGTVHKPGDTVTSEDGTKKIVLGYTGHSETTLQNIDPDRGLYFGPKQVAQRYAHINGGPNGAVGLVVANEPPKGKDFGAQNFEGPHAPLSSDGMKRLGVQVIHHEKVETENELGDFAAISRMVQSFLNTPDTSSSS